MIHLSGGYISAEVRWKSGGWCGVLVTSSRPPPGRISSLQGQTLASPYPLLPAAAAPQFPFIIARLLWAWRDFKKQGLCLAEGRVTKGDVAGALAAGGFVQVGKRKQRSVLLV